MLAASDATDDEEDDTGSGSETADDEDSGAAGFSRVAAIGAGFCAFGEEGSLAPILEDENFEGSEDRTEDAVDEDDSSKSSGADTDSGEAADDMTCTIFVPRGMTEACFASNSPR